MTRFTEEGKNPNTGQNQERHEYHDHILLSHKKMETQNKKISHFPVFLIMTFNNKSPNTHSRHLTVFWKPALLTTTQLPHTTHIKIYHAASLHANQTPPSHIPLYEHKHYSSRQEGHHEDENAKGANETKNCRNERTSCSRTAPPDKPKSFRPLPHLPRRHLDNV